MSGGEAGRMQCQRGEGYVSGVPAPSVICCKLRIGTA
jgi:hypothetical protein